MCIPHYSSYTNWWHASNHPGLENRALCNFSPSHPPLLGPCPWIPCQKLSFHLRAPRKYWWSHSCSCVMVTCASILSNVWSYERPQAAATLWSSLTLELPTRLLTGLTQTYKLHLWSPLPLSLPSSPSGWWALCSCLWKASCCEWRPPHATLSKHHPNKALVLLPPGGRILSLDQQIPPSHYNDWRNTVRETEMSMTVLMV